MSRPVAEARAESALRLLSWSESHILAARARAALRILHGVSPVAVSEALEVDLLAITLPGYTRAGITVRTKENL